MRSSRLTRGAAAADLWGGTKPVGQIARELGFTSEARFDSWFRTETGRTPQEFRAARALSTLRTLRPAA